MSQESGNQKEKKRTILVRLIHTSCCTAAAAAAAAVQPSTLPSIIAVQTIRIVEKGRCFFLSFVLSLVFLR